jgi:hypothetical protein
MKRTGLWVRQPKTKARQDPPRAAEAVAGETEISGRG